MTPAYIAALAHRLIGTCDSLNAALEEDDKTDDDMTVEDCRLLDALCFECTGCNWWHGISELKDHEAMMCMECA